MGRQIDYKHEAIIKQLSSINRKLGTITGDGDSEGEGGDDSSHTVDIMDVTNGASVELLTDPRIWFEIYSDIGNYYDRETETYPLSNTYILNYNGKDYAGNIRFHFSDKNNQLNPFDNGEENQPFSSSIFPDALRVSADKIPYVIDLITHRCLNVENNYGSYYDINSLSIYRMSNSTNGEHSDEDEAQHYGPFKFKNKETHEEIDFAIMEYHNAYRIFRDDSNEYELTFVNFDNEVFPNGKMVWIPIINVRPLSS